MILRKFSLLFLVVFVFHNTYAQKVKSKNILGVSYYNLENFYDTISNGNNEDTAYTPQGSKKWNTEKYQTKIENIAKVISELNKDNQADLVALAGIESEEIVADLIKNELLVRKKYNVVFSKGTKENALGLAVIYDSKKIKYLWDSSFSLSGNLKPWETPSREGFHCKFLSKKQEIEIVVVDLPNTIEKPGKETESRRTVALLKLRNYLNLNNVSKGNSIVLGSINEDANSFIAASSLGYSNPDSLRYRYSDFAGIMLNNQDPEIGTYYHVRLPYFYDYSVISKSLYSNASGWQFKKGSFNIFHPEWLIHPEYLRRGHPFDTYYEGKWINGYSNHFPIGFIMTFDKKHKQTN